MEFVPLWLSIIDGPSWKILDLPPDLFRAWVLCLLAAQKHDYIDGRLPDTRTLAHWINAGRDEIEDVLARLVVAGLIDRDEDGHGIHDWQDWRDLKDPKALQRKRKERAEKKAKRDMSRNGHGDVTATSRDVTPHHTTTSIHQASNIKHQASPNIHPREAVGDDVVEFGRTTFGDRFELESVPSKLAGWRAAGYPDDWIVQALLCSSMAEAGRLASYTNTCLRRWKVRGSIDPGDVEKATAATPTAKAPSKHQANMAKLDEYLRATKEAS